MNNFESDFLILSKKLIQPQQPSGPLSHFTDVAGGIGILSHLSIWASSFECMNDRGELRHGLELWIPEILTFIENVVIHDENGEILRQNLKKFFEDEIISPLARPYIASFVEDGESPYHWSAYADRGRGVSIDFKFVDVSKMGNSIVVPVIYCDLEKRNIIRKTILEIQSVYKKWQGRVSDKQLLEEILRQLVMVMHLEASRFKSIEWAHEREWRVVTFLNRVRGVDEKHGSICFRNRGSEVVDYIKLNLPEAKISIQDLRISIIAKNFGEESWKILVKSKGLTGQVLRSKVITG